MKIRRPIIQEAQRQLFLYENRKHEYFLVAIPDLHWSTVIHYEDGDTEVQNEVFKSLGQTLSKRECESLSTSIYQWTREM